MNSVDKLRKITKKKLIVLCFATLLPIALLIVMEYLDDYAEMGALKDLLVFRYGICVLIEYYMGSKIAKYINILNNIDYAQNETIRINDERNNFIEQKTYSRLYKISLYALCIGMMATAWFNRYIFYTLIVVFVVEIILYLFIKLFYSRKY